MAEGVFDLALQDWQSVEGCTELERYWAQSKEKREGEEIVGELAAQAGAHRRIVDLGCGTGRLIAWLPAFDRYDGYDMAPHMLELASEAYKADRRCRFTLHDADNGAPYRGTADLLISIDTSRHYHDPLGFLSMVVAKWPAQWYLFTILHGPEAQELINGQVVTTTALDAAQPGWGRVAATLEQPLAGSPWLVRYVLIEKA